MSGRTRLLQSLAFAFALATSNVALASDDGVWSIQKSSGEVWISASDAQPVSLKQEDTLKAGDTIRTGRSGRVLLVRGGETILISPNSVIGLPKEKKDGLGTTILQRAGSILLEVEKKNVQHFEVETPYLAAVVKGTQFAVTVSAKGTSVDVKRGQVAVADFKSGQTAMVMQGQAATSFAQGRIGLSLSGSGSFNQIEQGKPRAPSIERIPVPKGGLSAPPVENGKPVHALAPTPASPAPLAPAPGKLANAPVAPPQTSHGRPAGANVLHISSALGEVKLDVHKATRGLAHGGGVEAHVRSGGRSTSNAPAATTVWNESKPGSVAAAIQAASESGNGGASPGGNGNGPGGGAPPAGASGAAAASVAGKLGPSDDGPPGKDKGGGPPAGPGKGPAVGPGVPRGPGGGHGPNGPHGPPGGPPGHH